MCRCLFLALEKKVAGRIATGQKGLWNDRSSMDRSEPAGAAARLRRSEQRVERQKGIVAALHMVGLDTAPALISLAEFEAELETYRSDLERLKSRK